MTPGRALAVLLAGGTNRRYGAHKALETVGGMRIVDRALAALDEACGPAVIVANERGPYEDTGRPIRPDLRPGTGVLGGILTAARWAMDEGRDGALVLACDMPFVPVALLRQLVHRADVASVSLAESTGPRGFEPLCAVYGVDCVGAIERALDRGDRAIVSFFPEIEVRPFPLEQVEAIGDPDRMFFNMNRPDERARAEALVRMSDDPRRGDNS